MEENMISVEKAQDIFLSVTGSLINAYIICPRKAWLMSRQINPDGENIYLYMGRLLQEQSYSRKKKEVHLEHLALDLVYQEEEGLVVAEIKRSSKGIEAARMQLAFYLYELEEMGIEARGELRFPEERKREELVLNEELRKEVEKMKASVKNTVLCEQPPLPCWSRFCKNCAYMEFCWA